jgi:hypothetical protein
VAEGFFHGFLRLYGGTIMQRTSLEKATLVPECTAAKAVPAFYSLGGARSFRQSAHAPTLVNGAFAA